MVEDIDDPIQGFHQHIDMIYFCRLVGPPQPLKQGWRWVSRSDLAQALPLERTEGKPEIPPEDVRVLAHHAFRAMADVTE
jgi:hypothetical protein